MRRRETTVSFRVPLEVSLPRKQPRVEAFMLEHPRTPTPPPPAIGEPNRLMQEARRSKRKRHLIRDRSSDDHESLGSQRTESAPREGDLDVVGNRPAPRKPRRKYRRRLIIEDAMVVRPTLPKMASPTLRRYKVDGGVVVDEDDFQTYLGVNDNDNIKEPGVASRLARSTILPRDEKGVFKNLPKAEDTIDYLVMKAAQQAVVINA